MRSLSNLFISFLLAFLSFGANAAPVSEWMEQQYSASKAKLFKNISPEGSRPGTVVASPSRRDPDYYYHWIRDAALVMMTVERLAAFESKKKEVYLKNLYQFIELTRFQQSQQTLTGLGEVKFYVDGTPFLGPWGRPQNDGPALRALALTRFAHYLIAENQLDYVKKYLYDNKLPSEAIIKKDLEYVSHNWKNHDFDLWEECQGHHFFTRMAQHRSLVEGADLARKLGDSGAADWYQMQANLISNEIQWHWNKNAGIFVATLNRVGGIDYKHGMDSSVIIAALVASTGENTAVNIKDDRLLSSVKRMEEKFAEIYNINRQTSALSPAIGRYPEDRYDGYNTGKSGNPWFINTLAFASYYYKLAADLRTTATLKINPRNVGFFRSILRRVSQQDLPESGIVPSTSPQFGKIIEGLIKAGDGFVERVKYHASQDGNLSEQMNRETGHMQGAENLTWSHAAFIDTYLDRKEAIGQ